MNPDSKGVGPGSRSLAPLLLAMLACARLHPELAGAGQRGTSFLVPIAPDRISDAELAILCSRLTAPCDPLETRAYVERDAAAAPVYLIENTGPKIIRLNEGTTGDVGHADIWDFSGYRHSYATPKSEPMSIYPALYPAPEGKPALALVSELHEGYSGGGAIFKVADFVVLSTAGASSAAKWTLLYRGVPFECGSTSRACFSDRGYAKSPHCEDNYEGTLHLTFGNSDQGAWHFTWEEVHWPGGVTAAHKKVTRRTFTMPKDIVSSAARLPAAVNFCGGPVG